jgi:peroxiredoxin
MSGSIRPLYRLLLTFLLASAAVAHAQANEEPAAPDFALRTVDNQNLRLSEFRGDVVLLNFWASWCGECRQSMPALEDLYSKYRRAGLVLLSINMDDDMGRAATMARALKVSFPVLVDTRKDVSKLYKVEAMPLTILIDREGVVRYSHNGYQLGDEQQFLEQLRALLKE